MKKLLLSSLAALAVTGSSAFAADLRMPVKAPMAPPPVVTSWTGCYLNAGGGYGLWDQEESETAFGLTTSKYDNGGRGWLGRFGGGCDYQISPSFVIGAFGDYDFMDLHGTAQAPNFTALGGGGPPAVANEKESSAWYAGARIGYLITPSVLTYVDGGWTQTRFDQRVFFNPVTGAALGSFVPAHTFNGWFIGGGVEYAINFLPLHGLFLRTEYRFGDYGKDDLAVLSTATGAPIGTTLHDEKFVQTITTSLVWRFNFGGPIGARY